SYDVYPEIALNVKAIKKNGLIDRQSRKMNEKLFGKVSKVIALSSEMGKFLEKNRKIDPNKITVIPNWHDDIYEEKLRLNKFHDYKTYEDIVVSYFGNMGLLQNISSIIESAKSINNKNVKYLIAGHGIKMNYIKSQIEENNLKNISFHKYLTGSDFKEALFLSDLFVVSL